MGEQGRHGANCTSVRSLIHHLCQRGPNPESSTSRAAPGCKLQGEFGGLKKKNKEMHQSDMVEPKVCKPSGDS